MNNNYQFEQKFLMTRTNNNNIDHSPSRTSSSSSSAIAQPSSTEPKDIINQNELTIQKLLLELQDDLKQTKECYNASRDAWLSVQQKSSTSPNENNNSQLAKTNLTHALTNVQNEIDMYKTALEKISQVRQLQIEIANVTKNHIDANRSHTTRRGLADLLSHMAYVLKIWYGSEHSGNCSNKVSTRVLNGSVTILPTIMLYFFSRVIFHRHFVVLFLLLLIMSVMLVI
jgi:hypothetical protein